MSATPETESYVPKKPPEIRGVAFSDVRWALSQGLRDFASAPLYGLFFGGVYVAGGMIILAALTVFDMPWMIIPIAIGFPLIGPFVAVGLYEVSRRRAAREPLVVREVLGVVIDQRHRQLGWMAFVVLFIFWIWIYQARLLLALFLGFKSFATIGEFLRVITMTESGIGFLATGTLVGAALAFVLYSATVIAMPLLLDRDVDFITAMITSFKTVFAHPGPMLAWGIIIAVLTILALVPAFLGLIVVLPVLGHATWHLYERAVVREA